MVLGVFGGSCDRATWGRHLTARLEELPRAVEQRKKHNLGSGCSGLRLRTYFMFLYLDPWDKEQMTFPRVYGPCTLLGFQSDVVSGPKFLVNVVPKVRQGCRY